MASTLQVRNTLDFTGIKDRALADARRMQAAVDDECNRTGKPRPEYELSELIGKGSFGRVYKATSTRTQQQVAIKIIDIEQSDSESLSTSQADTLSDLLKEIKSLKLLAASGARNINLVIEAIPVAQSMWMITEYCAGGSVATLMKPTHPAGLQEKWIIPILREVAEAMFWVHGEGIIHRDIKCANILVTEAGSVQLCDFGVSGIIETKLDKRSTVIGTPHWMAPELLLADSSDRMSYGTEVDIWAFGAMVYEIASGYPPNVQVGMDFRRLCNFLRQNAPRLEGDEFSPGLRSLVEYCLQSDPMRRPTIEQIQQHTYIANTHHQYPTDSLAMLVRAYKMWEGQGGSRKSLFFAGGAQGPADPMPNSSGLGDDDWNFSTTAAFDQSVFGDVDAQAVYDVYGSNVDFAGTDYVDEPTARPVQARGRASRRRPPQLPKLKAPLEKVFDPDTMSSYADNARVYYGRPAPPPPQSTSDLPLRDDSSQATQVRESLIDLDASFGTEVAARFVDMETIKGPRASHLFGGAGDFNDYDFSNPPASDQADTMNYNSKDNRRTQDWKFPSISEPPASAGPEAFRFPFTNTDDHSNLNLATVRPGIVHHPTEPLTSRPYNDLAMQHEPPRSSSSATNNRESVSSLIDLDMSLDVTRPTTSHSDVGSINGSVAYMGGDSMHSSTNGSVPGSVHGSEYSSTGPFELERQPSLYGRRPREPSVYIDLDDAYVDTVAPSWSSVESGRSTREPSIYVEAGGDSYTPTREPSLYGDAGDHAYSTGWESNYSESANDTYASTYTSTNDTYASTNETYASTNDTYVSTREPSIYVESGEAFSSAREPSIYADAKYDSYKANREPSLYVEPNVESGDTFSSAREPSIYADAKYDSYKSSREPSLYVESNEAYASSREPSIYVDSANEAYSTTREPSIYAESINGAYTASSSREPSIYVDANTTAYATNNNATREPSIYISDNNNNDDDFASHLANLNINGTPPQSDSDAQYTSNSRHAFGTSADFSAPNVPNMHHPLSRRPSSQASRYHQDPRLTLR